MIVVEGGKLSPPKPIYGNSVVPKTFITSWSCSKLKFVEPKGFPKWTILKLGQVRFDITHYRPFKEAFESAGMIHEGESNVKRPEDAPTFHHVEDPKDVSQLRQKFDELRKKEIRLLLVILPDTGSLLYANYKLLADCKYGLSRWNYTLPSVPEMLMKPTRNSYCQCPI